MNPIWFEIRAAAYAGKGDFENAQKDQATAVSRAKKLVGNTAPQAARLAEVQVRQAMDRRPVRLLLRSGTVS
jgi:hypothetical protein